MRTLVSALQGLNLRGLEKRQSELLFGGSCITPRKGSIQIMLLRERLAWAPNLSVSDDGIEIEEFRLFLKFVAAMKVDVLPGDG
ncbi:MAG: hypothetical protein QOE55_4644 [Acidobacteriaceae bacterium]|nr:hypothetical protein [Acidobacteriaceae bacterium]